MKKIIFLTGSRGEWGYIRPILRLIQSRKDVDYKLIVTNMQLLPVYGNSYKEILNDGFHIDYAVNMSIDGYNHYTHAKSLGICLSSIPDILFVEKPDWFVLAGDRGEQLMGAISGAYTYTPTAHIQAGELSGNIDGMSRHAIGKLVHMHFAANKDAADRLIKLGEEDFRVFNVGAPQIDELVQSNYTDLNKIERDYLLKLKDGYILVVLHPVTEEANLAGEQAKILIEVLNEYDYPKVVIMPNNDAGSILVQDALIKYKKGKYHMFSNLKREDYLGLLKNTLCIVGNSSSGLLEAPTFKTPAVNVGRRQNLRFRGINVIDCDFNYNSIKNSIDKAISDDFHNYLKINCYNPYGDGHSSERILDLLMNTKVDDKWLSKKLTY